MEKIFFFKTFEVFILCHNIFRTTCYSTINELIIVWIDMNQVPAIINLLLNNIW